MLPSAARRARFRAARKPTKHAFAAGAPGTSAAVMALAPGITVNGAPAATQAETSRLPDR